MKNICVCGIGKLGSCIAAAFSGAGIAVNGFDVNSEYVAAINAGNAPVQEPQLEEYISRAHERGFLSATTDPKAAVQHTQACIFVVPTPSLPNGRFDNRILLEAIETIAKIAPDPYLFIIASTVAPGSCVNEVLPLLQRYQRGELRLAYTPQFIALGTVIPNLLRPDFLLVGELNLHSGGLAERLWQSLSAAPVHRMSLTEAELAKLSVNCALTAKIGMANEIGMIAESLGCNPHRVLEAVGSDHRIGNAYFRYGFAVAGPCLPRDDACLQNTAASVRRKAHIAAAADRVNTEFLWALVQRCLAKQGSIGILGTAYKPGTPHTDRSPALRLKCYLEAKGRTVLTHDPQAAHSHTLEEVLQCETVVVMTDWPEYRELEIPATANLIDPAAVIRKNQRNERREAYVSANDIDH